MTKEVAVVVGENGETTSLYDKGNVVVYQKKRGEWSVLKEKRFVLDKSLGMQELRNKMAAVLDFLGECKIFVGLSITGVPYFELEKAKFSVWEFEGKPMDFLDYVLEEEEERHDQEANKEENAVMLTPVETSDGYYRISIKEIQENDTGVTSKQVLLPFLRKGQFYSLQVICNHVPPWLEAELLSGDYSGDIEKISNGEVRITIAKSCCHEM